jgi:hypothetical protein
MSWYNAQFNGKRGLSSLIIQDAAGQVCFDMHVNITVKEVRINTSIFPPALVLLICHMNNS